MDERKERNGEGRGITKGIDEREECVEGGRRNEREERGATWNTRRREDE
jgi:hypothetical protein